MDDGWYSRVDRRTKGINRLVKMCFAAKGWRVNDQRDEREALANSDDQMMHKRVKDLTGKRKLQTGKAIRKKNGEMAMKKQEVLDRWKKSI